MLSCHECERYIPVFLDHALEVKESLDVQAHLQSCSSCADRVESEQCIRTFVRQYLDVPPPPDGLKRAMILRAMQAERQPGWWAYLPAPTRLRDFAMGVATAALLALVMYGSFPDLSSDPDLQKVGREASLAYGIYTKQHMPLEVVSADDSTVTKWLNKHMGYHIKMPCITDTATQLLGGRLCSFMNRKSVALMYQRHGVPILLFAFHGDHMSLPSQNNPRSNGQAPVHVRSVSGRPVAMWQRDGVVYSMVGDVQRDDLMQVAATVNYR
jgi:anti-sigma factor RsiW